jgi:hypothetical protein
MAEARRLAMRERNRLMKEHGVGRPYPKKPKRLKKRIYGVYPIDARSGANGSGIWRAVWPVEDRIVAKIFSEGAHPSGAARQKAIAARLAAEAKYPRLRKNRGY